MFLMIIYKIISIKVVVLTLIKHSIEVHGFTTSLKKQQPKRIDMFILQMEIYMQIHLLLMLDLLKMI